MQVSLFSPIVLTLFFTPDYFHQFIFKFTYSFLNSIQQIIYIRYYIFQFKNIHFDFLKLWLLFYLIFQMFHSLEHIAIYFTSLKIVIIALSKFLYNNSKIYVIAGSVSVHFLFLCERFPFFCFCFDSLHLRWHWIVSLIVGILSCGDSNFLFFSSEYFCLF